MRFRVAGDIGKLLDVSALLQSAESQRSENVVAVGIGGVLDLRDAELIQPSDTVDHPSFLPRRIQSRKKQRHKNRKNGNCHEEFDKGEKGVSSAFSHFPSPCFGFSNNMP